MDADALNSTDVLKLVLQHLREEWFNDDVGVVAAAVIDGNALVTATSRYIEERRAWLHAESAALQKFIAAYGRKPSRSSTAVITLSPCIRASHSRLGAACADVLVESGINRIWFGCLDCQQAPEMAVYHQAGFTAALVYDPILAQVCRNLFGLFGELADTNSRFSYLLGQGPNPWPEIKRIIGLEPFSPLLI